MSDAQKGDNHPMLGQNHTMKLKKTKSHLPPIWGGRGGLGC